MFGELFQHTAARRRLGCDAIHSIKCVLFQHTAARRRLDTKVAAPRPLNLMFQHTAARRRLGFFNNLIYRFFSFNTQPPEGGWVAIGSCRKENSVSTHSRPKAAGFFFISGFQVFKSFNTQPPEGGWWCSELKEWQDFWFQHTAARRRLGRRFISIISRSSVSTHSRPKAAGPCECTGSPPAVVSTHSRPKAAGAVLQTCLTLNGCFNTQPPEGGWRQRQT